MLRNIYRDSDDKSVIRKRQIDTLKIFNANVFEVIEDVEYRVDFNSGGKQLSLIVKLTPEFPLEKPTLQVSPPVSHQWVSESGNITSAPGLLNFTVYSDLGRVVQAIVREFELRPPSLLNEDISTQGASRDICQASASSVAVSHGSFSYQPSPITGNYRDYVPAPSTSTVQPTIPVPSPMNVQPALFPELVNMSVAELNKLYSNPDRIEEFLENTPQVKELNRATEDLITRIQELSKENLAKEPLLIEASQELEERYEKFSALKKQFESLQNKYQKLADRYNPNSIRESLKSAVIKSDELSEQIAEQFLKGEMELDMFLNVYMQRRKLSHCRKIKEEKLSHQLLELQRAGF